MLVRLRDPVASAQLVDLYTPILRREIRAKLSRYRMNRLLDPLDISQMVLGSFFMRLTESWPPVSTSDQLTALLVVITRNKLRDEIRRHTAGRRDHRRLVSHCESERLHHFQARGPSPIEMAVCRELCTRAMSHFTPNESSLLEDRLSGRSWGAIGADRGIPPVVLRKQLHRAIARVRHRLAGHADVAPLNHDRC